MQHFWKWWAIVVTVLFAGYLFYQKGPVPFTDNGHNCYDVQDEKAARAMLKVFALGGLHESFTFDSGPVHQCVLSDGQTVLLWLDKADRKADDTGNARSLVVDDPLAAAQKTRDALINAGYTAQIEEPPMGLGQNKLFLLKTNAMNNACLVFRRHALAMGKPPNQRTITRQ